MLTLSLFIAIMNRYSARILLYYHVIKPLIFVYSHMARSWPCRQYTDNLLKIENLQTKIMCFYAVEKAAWQFGHVVQIYMWTISNSREVNNDDLLISYNLDNFLIYQNIYWFWYILAYDFYLNQFFKRVLYRVKVKEHAYFVS